MHASDASRTKPLCADEYELNLYALTNAKKTCRLQPATAHGVDVGFERTLAYSGKRQQGVQVFFFLTYCELHLYALTKPIYAARTKPVFERHLHIAQSLSLTT